MTQKYKKRVTVSENGYVLTLIFRGVYTEFQYMIAQEGDLKGIATLRFKNAFSSVGNIVSPTNLDYYLMSDRLCLDIERKNSVVDRSIVQKLYDQALKKMKKEA